jgi:phage baseplate assembly protein W
MGGSADFPLVGTGWAWPLGVGSGGGIRLLSGPDDVDSAIRLILSTRPGDRLMRPQFGCRIWELVFAPIDANTIGTARQHVREALFQWEPRIAVRSVRVDAYADHGLLAIEIDYDLRSTLDRRTLVHPFYVIPHEEKAV